MKRNVPYSKKLNFIPRVPGVIFAIALILCIEFEAPFLVCLILGLLMVLFWWIGSMRVKYLSKNNYVEIYEDKVAISINDKMECFYYAELSDIKLIDNDIYLIPTEESIEWRLASNSNIYIKTLYKKKGAIACISELVCGIPIELVYKTLISKIEAYYQAMQVAKVEDCEEDEDALQEFIDDTNDILDAIDEGMAEGERIANKITKIFNR